MPSHSSKQHRFMEAVAHSPSFAKKVGVPQSVGKDFSAADKGRKFSKGGEMAESKKMVGKEVAFMKKKGAPAKMIKHEMSEMKGMKKGGRVRRMAEGGETDMSMGYGDPFAKPRNYEEEKERGAKNLEGIKNFFGFKKKEEKEAPVPRPSLNPSLLRFNKEESSASTSRVSNQSPRTRRESEDTLASDATERDDAASMDKTAKGPQYTSSITTEGGEYSGDGFPAFKPEKSVTRTRKPVGIEKVEKKERVITEPVDTSYSALEARRATKKPKETKPESKSAGKFGMASDETRASVRKGLGSFLDFFDLSKAHEREFGKKMAKGGNVKRMRYGGDTGMGQPMGGAASMEPATPSRVPPRVTPRIPLLNPNRPGLSDLAKQKMGVYNQGMLDRIAAKKSKPMAEGGVARADGIAKKGKTEGKMVKMASGGFVKSADGCAQRGKTKAFQVKMNRGGMC